MANTLRNNLQRKIRECSLSGGEVLRSLDKAVNKLEDFAKIMQPLQEVVQKYSEADSSISKTLLQVKDQADLSREANSLIKDLQIPIDSRSHLKNIDRGHALVKYYQNNPDIDGVKEKILQALGSGYLNCIKFFEEQLTRYNEIYGISIISAENTAQIDMIDNIREFIEICKVKVPQYWQIYVKLRSSLIYKNVNIQKKMGEPYVKGSHNVILVLNSFIRCCAVEKEFLTCVLGTATVQDWLGEVTDAAFHWLSSQTELFLSKKSDIIQQLDIMAAFNSHLNVLESDLGKTVKYYTLSKLQTTLMQKCQTWYREYILYIQSVKIEFGDFVNDLSLQLSGDLKRLHNYSEGLLLAKLEQSASHLVTTLIDTYRVKIKAIKQQGLVHIFMINNLSYWISVLQDLEFLGSEDVMARIEKEMISEIEEYCKSTWGKLLGIMTDPYVIEFKKPGVLSRSSRKTVKNKFKTFNSAYIEVFNYHKNFAVFSKDIIQLLRKKNYALVVPNYKEFLKKYLAVDFTTRREKYTLYPLENVEHGVLNMYSLKNISS